MLSSSEHVVLRLMRLVREGKLPHDLVQILYVDQDDEGKSSAIELPIDEFGEFTEDWPGGFFEERMNEI
jgi:predicted ATPase